MRSDRLSLPLPKSLKIAAQIQCAGMSTNNLGCSREGLILTLINGLVLSTMCIC